MLRHVAIDSGTGLGKIVEAPRMDAVEVAAAEVAMRRTIARGSGALGSMPMMDPLGQPRRPSAVGSAGADELPTETGGAI